MRNVTIPKFLFASRISMIRIKAKHVVVRTGHSKNFQNCQTRNMIIQCVSTFIPPTFIPLHSDFWFPILVLFVPKKSMITPNNVIFTMSYLKVLQNFWLVLFVVTTVISFFTPVSVTTYERHNMKKRPCIYIIFALN